MSSFIKATSQILMLLVSTALLNPLVTYQLFVTATKPSLFSLIALIISAFVSFFLQMCFIGVGAIKSKKNVLEDYLYQHPGCTYMFFDLNECIDKRVLDAMHEFAGFNLPFNNTDKEKSEGCYIYMVKPIDNQVERDSNLLAYPSPMGMQGLGSFIFMRNNPDTPSKFSFFHELGHLTFDNSMEHLEKFRKNYPYILTILWMLPIITWNALSISTITLLTVITLIIIPYSLKAREESFRLRDEKRADAFAIRHISAEERDILIRVLHKRRDFYNDESLITQAAKDERYNSLLGTLLSYDPEFDSLHALAWANKDFEAYVFSAPGVFFLVLSVFLAFISNATTLSTLVIYAVLAIALYIGVRVISRKDSDIMKQIVTWIQKTNAKNLVKKMSKELMFLKNKDVL